MLGEIEAVVLDIEGTVISISFVKDVLFPFARKNIRAYLESHWEEPELRTIVDQLHTQAIGDVKYHGSVPPIDDPAEAPKEALIAQLEANLLWQMDADRKAAPLKALQGLVWKEGYASGQLRAPLYPDVVPMLTAWKSRRLKLAIYSSGSVQAQQLLFSHTTEGDVTTLLDGYFDINTAGVKTDARSYEVISEAISVDPSKILFLTDIVAEAQAACKAGFQVRLVVRPGNKPLTEDEKASFGHISSLEQNRAVRHMASVLVPTV
ncbi:enolase-phosphatase E1 [Rhipicephalus sanguineus]|uniref:enolase-phosphatase E1 n=1 Tax=Rhipicephalus sanguineus TaxID=34632 RepID=UPI001893736C|nr:enolase-phosphatase E1 [Rhipicephalus sanguineus]